MVVSVTGGMRDSFPLQRRQRGRGEGGWAGAKLDNWDIIDDRQVILGLWVDKQVKVLEVASC